MILFWELYFLPFSVHAQTNVVYLALLSVNLYPYNNWGTVCSNTHKILMAKKEFVASFKGSGVTTVGCGDSAFHVTSDEQGTLNSSYILIIKPKRCTNFSTLFLE
jgi:hypothetical protein